MAIFSLRRLTWLVVAFALFPGGAIATQSRVFGWIEEGFIEPEHIAVKVKLDTGALTSSMDARDIERFVKDGDAWVRFKIEVLDENSGKLVVSLFERPVERRVKVRGAGGAEHRPVVFMDLCIGDRTYREEFSLNNRGKMNYPVLIGRRTIRHLGLVDVSHTFTRKPKCAKGS